MTDEESDAAAFDVDQLYHPGAGRSLRRLPRLFAGAFRLVSTAARRQLILTILPQAVGSVTLALQVLIGKQLLTRLLADNTSKDFSSTAPSVIALAIALAVTLMTTIVRSGRQRLLSEMVARFAMQQVVAAASSADLARFENPTFHDRLQRAIVNASVRPFQMTTGLLSVAGSVLGSLAVGVALLTIAPLFFALGVAAAIPLTILSLRLGRALYRFAVEQAPTDRERSYIQRLLVDVDPAKEIRSYELDELFERRFSQLYERRIGALRRLIRRRTAQGVAGGALTAAISGGSLGLLIVFVSDGRVSLAGTGAAAAALILLGTQLYGLAGGIGQLYESALFVEDIDDLVHVVRGTAHFARSELPAPAVGLLTVRDLSFTYPSRSEPSLSGVDMDIRPGQVVALVGENGSGKTTLAKLLAGLYRPQSGRICWNGRDTATMEVAQVRARVAVLFQDFVRYSLSARENVSMGRSERADDDYAIFGATIRSGAHTFLRLLPNGYDTYLGPHHLGGSGLSEGQWQRMALARAFFRDADLVILDEPTAALDPRAEAQLFAAVRRLFAAQSVVLISHRFATVRLADHIYVLDQGRVVEHGDHESLMASAGLYAELFTLQAASFGLQDAPRAPDRP